MKQICQGSVDIASMLLSTSSEDPLVQTPPGDVRQHASAGSPIATSHLGKLQEQQEIMRTELDALNSSMGELRADMAKLIAHVKEAIPGKQP